MNRQSGFSKQKKNRQEDEVVLCLGVQITCLANVCHRGQVEEGQWLSGGVEDGGGMFGVISQTLLNTPV